MTIGLVCHDAGAGNQIMAHVRELEKRPTIGFFSGPSVQVAEYFLPNIKLANNLAELIDASDVVVSGTGWSSDLEHEARIMASNFGKYSIAVVDHWVNYKERFSRDGVTQVPDEVWVFDDLAYDKALVELECCQISLQPPTYRDFIVKKTLESKIEPSGLLYMCEPLRRSHSGLMSKEEIVLIKFLTRLLEGSMYRNKKIYLRPHPSELETKYNHIIERFETLNIEIETGDLAESLAKVDAVAGHSTYGLYLAHHANRRVISSVPFCKDTGGFHMNKIIPMEVI